MIDFRFKVALVCAAVIMPGITMSQNAPQSAHPRFAIRLVDEAVDPSTKSGPPSDDHIPNSQLGLPNPGAQWLKRQGGVEGELGEAHIADGAGGETVVLFSLTPKGRDQFTAVTRANIGHRLAIVVDGKIVVSWRDDHEFTDGGGQISSYYTKSEAQQLAAEMMAIVRDAGSGG
jgi:preprotein translocase subunit SecD